MNKADSEEVGGPPMKDWRLPNSLQADKYELDMQVIFFSCTEVPKAVQKPIPD